MDKRTIIFRADGGLTIGMGHFIRTLALAEMLNKHFNCIYATQTPSEYQISEITKVCQNLIDLPNDNSHFNEFLNLLHGNEIVVLDNYFFTTDYQRTIKAKGCKLVCIDDLHDKHFVSDIVINHAEGLSPTAYDTENYTKLLLGYKYALLRKEYLIDQSISNPKEYSCFIMMGAADPFYITLKITSILVNLNFELPIAVVVGEGYSEENQFKQFENIIFFKGISASHIFQLMQLSEFGILPSSTVAIEACAARLPFICGYFIDNQKEIYSGIKKEFLAVCVDNFIELEKNILTIAIKKICESIVCDNIIQNQMERLDKKSKERFLQIFQKL